MRIVEKNGKKYDLNDYDCRYCSYIDNSRPWTGYGMCTNHDMEVDLDNSGSCHSSIEEDSK